MSGRLVIVATPIGNLGDLAPRAVDALSSADLVACEDTRRTRKLFSHAGLPTPPMVVVNEHTEVDQCERIVERLDRGERVVLVSDAGMPVVSDPGERLIAAALDRGHSIEVVPGPSAGIAALALSGLPAARYCFEGFLPRRGGGRAERLAALATEERTSVLFEAPHRLVRTLDDLAATLGGDRPVAVARELTKRHEEVYRGDLDGALQWAGDGVKGEVVVIVGGAPPAPPAADGDVVAAVAAAMAAGESHASAARTVAAEMGLSRRRVYELTLGRD
ncbi:MAG: 16S rRNA (cytidine(1402)-2'-O)-methyltransferase [Acidimicrobiales bacterium]